MSSDRWVRIVDPSHVLRENIDEVYPNINTWIPVIPNLINTKVGDSPKFVFRCRLSDVPSGTKIVDPEDGYKLVDPWETSHIGVNHYWDKYYNMWMLRPYPSTKLSRVDIYRRCDEVNSHENCLSEEC